jgi:hypothetical protein
MIISVRARSKSAIENNRVHDNKVPRSKPRGTLKNKQKGSKSFTAPLKTNTFDTILSTPSF